MEDKKRKQVYHIDVTVFNNGDVEVAGSADYTILGITATGTSKISCNVDDVANKALDYAEIMANDDPETGLKALLIKLAQEVNIKQSTIDRLLKLDKKE